MIARPQFRVTVCVWWLVMWTMTTAGVAGSKDDAIALMIREAQQAETVADADATLDQATALLDALREGPRQRLKAEILQARGTVRVPTCLRDPENVTLRGEARQYFLQALNHYKEVQSVSEQKADERVERLGERDPELDQVYRRWIGDATYVTYKIAWCYLSLGLVEDEAGARRTYLEHAVKVFDEFTHDGYRSHTVIANCFLGQAQCYYELDRFFKVGRLLADITSKNCPPDVYPEIVLLRVRASQGLGSHADVEYWAEMYFSKAPQGAVLDGVGINIALARAKSLPLLADPELNPESHESYRARINQFVQWIEHQPEPVCTELLRGLLRQGVKISSPRAAMIRAVDAFADERFDQALIEATAGLTEITADGQETVTANLRFTAAACAWNLGRWAEAHRRAWDFVDHHPDDQRTECMVRRCLASAERAILDGHSLDSATLDACSDFSERQYPGMPELDELRWCRALRWLSERQFDRARTTLEEIGPPSPAYLRAQYGLALAISTKAETMGGATGEISVATFNESADALKRFVKATLNELPTTDQPLVSKVITLGIEVSRRMLSLQEPDPGSVLSLLDLLDSWPLAAGKDVDQRLAVRIEAHALGEDLTALLVHTADAIKSERTSRHIVRAITLASEPLEAEYERVAEAGRVEAAATIARHLAAMYTFLLDYADLGSDGKTDTRAVRLRLARVLTRLNRPFDAIRQLQRIVADKPDEPTREIIYGLGMAHEEVGHYEEALHYWTWLRDATPKPSTEYFDARYHLVACYLKMGRKDEAQSQLTDLRLRFSGNELGDWSTRFEEIERQLEENRH